MNLEQLYFRLLEMGLLSINITEIIWAGLNTSAKKNPWNLRLVICGLVTHIS